MQPVDWMLRLQEQFSAEDVQRFFLSVAHEPLAARALMQENFLERCLSRSGNDLRGWSLANLSLSAVGSSYTAADLSSPEMKAIDNSLRSSALQAYEHSHKAQQPPESLAEAGLLALALRERRRLTRGWHGLAAELAQGSMAFTTWKTALACLFGMVPDGLDLCAALLPRQNLLPGARWISHILLANPISDEERIQILVTLMRKISPEMQTAWLRDMRLSGQVDLTTWISQELVSNITPLMEDTLQKSISILDQPDAALRQSMEFQHLAELLRISGETDEAITLLRKAQKVSRAWLAGLSLQVADLMSQSGQNEQAQAAVEQTLMLDADQADYPAELIMIMGQAWQSRLAVEDPLNASTNPLVVILKAEQMGVRGELEAGQKMAREAVLTWLADFQQNPTVQPTRYAFDWHPEIFANALINLGLDDEAIAFLRATLTIKPADDTLIDLLNELLIKRHHVEAALEQLNLVVALHPGSIGRQRNLARLLAQTKRWPAAYAAWKQTRELAPQPQLEDQLGLAEAALEIGKIQEAVEICTKILEEDENQPLAGSILAKALILSGQPEQAIPVLVRVTALLPEQESNWLLLAEAQRNIGENQRALETLRAASLAVADSAEIQLQLGSICLQTGSPAEALPSLRKAVQLSPSSSQAAILLGDTLLSLGHYSEAQMMLTEAFARWPQDCDLAYVYGRSLLGIGDRAGAIHALEIAIQTPTPDMDRYILLVETLLDGFTPGSVVEPENAAARLERAEQVLQAALTWMPDHWTAQMLQAELLLAKQENQAAKDLYQRLMEDDQAQDPANYWRIQAGLGLAAMRLGQLDTAMDALQDALLAQPQNLGLNRLLAEACLKANQRQEALQRAYHAMKMAANDLENLLWFADLMSEMGETGEAVNAMKVITQMAPERPGFWLKRAGLEVENGDLEAAQGSLCSMLELPDLTHDHLRLAALTYLRMQDQTAALNCLDLAATLASPNSTQLLLEMTCLNFRLGRHDMALESCQRVAAALPNDGILQVLAADLQCNLDHWTAALVHLDRALAIWEQGHRTGEIGRWQRLAQSGWIEAEWLASANRLGMISLRRAMIYYRLNEPDLAQQNIELSLQQLDNYAPALYLAVEMAMECGDLETAQKLLASQESLPSELESTKLELDLFRGEDGNVAELVRQAMVDRPRDFRLRLLQIRLLSRSYDWTAAHSLFERAMADIKDRKNVSGSWSLAQPVFTNRMIQRGDLLRLVDTALELRRWRDAIELAAECIRIYGDPTAFLYQAKVLVICAEHQRRYALLQVITHTPGIEMISAERSLQFETAIEKAGVKDPMPEIMRWLERGRAAFGGGVQFRHTGNEYAKMPEDVAALMAALRLGKNYPAAIKLAAEYPQQPAVLAELALVQLETEPQEALLTARHLAEISPADPINLAILATIADRLGEEAEALSALENSLQIWPDEPAWHAWAARLAEKIQAGRVCQSHWEQALTLDPNRIDYALALGKTYNANQLWNKAVAILKRAAEAESENPQIWMELAEAQLGAGELASALESAEKSAGLLPEDVQPLLLCGKIALAMGKLDWALAYAQEAYKTDARNESTVLFLARVMEKRGKPADGLALIEKALISMDHSQELIFEQARLIRRLNGPKAALPVLARLSTEQPTSVEALRLMAQVQVECGDLSAAESSARKALDLQPDDAQTCLLLGKLLHKAGQLDQAVQYLNQAVSGENPDLEAFLELGRVYQSRREFQQAMRIYQQAILINPHDHRMYLAAGTVLREAKDYRASEAMFRRAAELAPDDINIQRQLGAVVALNLVYESQEVKFSYEPH